MPDLIFAAPELAALYDRMNPSRADHAFYEPLIMAAGSVLDIGCGTGTLLHAARDAGHRGRLCGLDPAPGMLAQARRRTDIRWIQGNVASMAWEGEFRLVVMTGHAFQVLVTDEDVRDALARIRRALTADGRFAFETRNPEARAWESWNSGERESTEDESGGAIRMRRQITSPFDGRVVSFSHTFTSDTWDAPRVSHSTLRFMTQAELKTALHQAGLRIEAQYGDWDRSAVTNASPEIITIARVGSRAEPDPSAFRHAQASLKPERVSNRPEFKEPFV